MSVRCCYKGQNRFHPKTIKNHILKKQKKTFFVLPLGRMHFFNVYVDFSNVFVDFSNVFIVYPMFLLFSMFLWMFPMFL